MTMAARVGPVSAPCPSTPHRHTPPARTGCAFPDKRRPSGLCGRQPVSVYVNPFAKVLNTYRCEQHDKAVVVEAAAEMGFQRVAIVPKSEKADRIARMEAGRG